MKWQENEKCCDNTPIEKVRYTDLDPASEEFNYVKDITSQSGMLIVDRIQTVENPTLQYYYSNMYQQKLQEFENVQEYLFFHATKWHTVDNICSENFDWRLTKKHRFGWGVNFSKDAYYASQFSDPYPEICKVMIGAKVLVGNMCTGHKKMFYPPPGYDTSINRDGLVIVKYEDHEYIPVYKISYHMTKDDEAYNNMFYGKMFDIDFNRNRFRVHNRTRFHPYQ